MRKCEVLLRQSIRERRSSWVLIIQHIQSVSSLFPKQLPWWQCCSCSSCKHGNVSNWYWKDWLNACCRGDGNWWGFARVLPGSQTFFAILSLHGSWRSLVPVKSNIRNAVESCSLWLWGLLEWQGCCFTPAAAGHRVTGNHLVKCPGQLCFCCRPYDNRCFPYRLMLLVLFSQLCMYLPIRTVSHTGHWWFRSSLWTFSRVCEGQCLTSTHHNRVEWPLGVIKPKNLFCSMDLIQNCFPHASEAVTIASLQIITYGYQGDVRHFWWQQDFVLCFVRNNGFVHIGQIK